MSTLTCHPKTGEAATFNQALCSLWAGGYGSAPAAEAGDEAGVPTGK